MPFEALECFTVSLMSAAAVSYAADLATPSTLATLQGMYGGLHYGVGEYMLARHICKVYIYVPRATEEPLELHFLRIVNVIMKTSVSNLKGPIVVFSNFH